MGFKQRDTHTKKDHEEINMKRALGTVRTLHRITARSLRPPGPGRDQIDGEACTSDE
jgi:hypothetical protein